VKYGLYSRCHVLVSCGKVVGIRECLVDKGWLRLGWQKGKVFGNVEGTYQSLSINLGGDLYERHHNRFK